MSAIKRPQNWGSRSELYEVLLEYVNALR